jgi:prepilin-type N-terminal cleavage/methylation domain-containing protein/prepilin-type processing-associated H-X9-DG protein
MPPTKTFQRIFRGAFTLVELLVVISIIGLLVALLLPAVQAAREAGRRMQCGNHLRQVGLGIANYHSAFNQLPRAWWLETPPKAFNGKPWGVAILPFIEQQALYESLDHSVLSADQTSPRNVVACQTPIVSYMCPSAPGNAAERKYRFNSFPAGLPFTASDLAPIDYTPSTGVRGLYAQHAYGTNLTNSREGAMQVVSPMFGGAQDGDFAGILDGLSNTLLMGERTGGSSVYSRSRFDSVATAALMGLEGGGWGDLLNGEHWLQGALQGGLSWPPQGGPCAINCTNARGFGFHSFHVGGAHFLFADGAVAYITESVEPYVFASYITRRGREVAKLNVP